MTNDSWDPYNSTFVYTERPANGGETGQRAERDDRAGGDRCSVCADPAEAQGVGTVTDGDGNTIAYTLEAAHGWLLQEVQPGDLMQTWVYDTDGDVTTMTDADGNTTTSTYSDGDLLSVTTPDDSTESYEYNMPYHEMTQETDGDGDVTVWVYDTSNGDVLSMTTAYGTSAAATTTYTWSDGLLTSETDADGNVTRYGYNDLRQLIAQQTGDVDDETFTYDGNGNPESSTVGVGGTAPETTYTVYSGANLLLNTTDADGDETSVHLRCGGTGDEQHGRPGDRDAVRAERGGPGGGGRGRRGYGRAGDRRGRLRPGGQPDADHGPRQQLRGGCVRRGQPCGASFVRHGLWLLRNLEQKIISFFSLGKLIVAGT